MSGGEEVELVGFTDASMDGHATVIYSRTKVSQGYAIRLIAARGCVTQLKIKADFQSMWYHSKIELGSVVLLAE